MKGLFNRLLPVGTRSVLFGAHCWFIHPFFVAAAWWRLYGRPREWQLWAAFVLHDLGYLGKPNMDGPEGETHPLLGARLLGWLVYTEAVFHMDPDLATNLAQRWYDFSAYHSRFLARRDGKPYSRLCVADKLACALEPWWLYLPRVWASGELWEYMALAGGKNGSKYAGEPNSAVVQAALNEGTIRGWHRGMTSYCREWALEHQDGRTDTWTPGG